MVVYLDKKMSRRERENVSIFLFMRMLSYVKFVDVVVFNVFLLCGDIIVVTKGLWGRTMGIVVVVVVVALWMFLKKNIFSY